MTINAALFTSTSEEWPTPQATYDALNLEYGPFDLDPCATDANHKAPRYFTAAQDGLMQSWTGRVYMNPPYGRQLGQWVAKAYASSIAGAFVVCLVPARTDTAWWHDYAARGEVRFIRGRLKFGDGKGTAPFPSAVIVFRPGPTDTTTGRQLVLPGLEVQESA